MKSRHKLMAAGLIGLAATATHAVNKCTLPDGRVVYQDAPCGNENRTSERVKTWENTPGNFLGHPSLTFGPPRQLAWTGRPELDLARVEAEIEITRMQGRDCDLALKVEKDLAKCAPFVSRMRTGGEYLQALDKLEQLIEKRPDGLPGALSRINSAAAEVQRRGQFVIAYIASSK